MFVMVQDDCSNGGPDGPQVPTMEEQPTQQPVEQPEQISNGPFGVVMVDVGEFDFRPKRATSKPIPHLRHVDLETAIEFAVQTNSRPTSRFKNRWAFVTLTSKRGYGVASVHVVGASRPDDPRALPPGDVLKASGLSRMDAMDMAIRFNEEIRKVALMPRRWAVVVREMPPLADPNPATDPSPAKEGAEA